MGITLEALLSVALGIGLAAATGFRIFIPLLVAGLAARLGCVPIGEGFSWLTTTPALVMLATAAVVETIGYYVPGVDHLLDLLVGPAGIAAGVLVSASVMIDLPPGVKWPVAIIAGGGIAGIVKGATAVLRAKTGVVTAGLGNPVVSTAETVGATGLSILAIAVPVLCVVLVLAALVWVARKGGRMAQGRWRVRRDR
jgi:hypothetical protein